MAHDEKIFIHSFVRHCLTVLYNCSRHLQDGVLNCRLQGRLPYIWSFSIVWSQLVLCASIRPTHQHFNFGCSIQFNSSNILKQIIKDSNTSFTRCSPVGWHRPQTIQHNRNNKQREIYQNKICARPVWCNLKCLSALNVRYCPVG